MSGVRIVPLMAAVLVTFVGGWSFNAQGANPPEREIVINIPAFRLTLFEKGEPIRSYPVGVGVDVKPSRLGETEIINEVADPTYYPPNWWKRGLTPIPPGPENPVGTRWLGLGFPSYGIHGTNNPESIGKAVSSGCIRMYNEDVEELSRLVGVGTPVRLVYNTIEVWSDRATDVPIIQIHPDIYRMGTNRLTNAQHRLEAANAWENVDVALLEEALNDASGVPLPVSVLRAPNLNPPDATEMVADIGYAAFPKRAVGLPLEGVSEALVRTFVDETGHVQRVDIAQTSGFDLLDAYALRVAELTLRYKPHDHMYVVTISVAFDVTDTSKRQLSYKPLGTVYVPTPTQLAAALN